MFCSLYYYSQALGFLSTFYISASLFSVKWSTIRGEKTDTFCRFTHSLALSLSDMVKKCFTLIVNWSLNKNCTKCTFTKCLNELIEYTQFQLEKSVIWWGGVEPTRWMNKISAVRWCIVLDCVLLLLVVRKNISSKHKLVARECCTRCNCTLQFALGYVRNLWSDATERKCGYNYLKCRHPALCLDFNGI